MALHVRVDRPRCIGAGNCIAVAPTAFDWLEGDFAKAAVVDVESVDGEVLRAAAYSCPTQAIEIEEVGELLPLQPSGATRPSSASRRRSCSPTSSGRRTSPRRSATRRGRRCCAGTTRPCARCSRRTTARRSSRPGTASSSASTRPPTRSGARSAIQRRLDQQRREHGFAPQVRIGVHYASAQQVEGNYRGKGVHEAARIAAVAEGSEILASRETAEGTGFRMSEPRSVELKGLSEPMEVVSVAWK